MQLQKPEPFAAEMRQSITKLGYQMKIPEDMQVGTIYSSNDFGDFEIISYENSNKVTVRFINTGGIKKTKSCHVRSGGVRDDNMPSVFGVGFIGTGKYKSKDGKYHTSAYTKWHAMMERCYSDKWQEKKPTYKGCAVCEEWHNFQNFAKWYDENHPKDGGKYQLDKDLSCYGERGKLYSPETCVFVPPQVNCEEAHAKHWKLRSPSGEVFEVYNLAKFCRENGLTNGNVVSMYNGRQKSSKGWTKAN